MNRMPRQENIKHILEKINSRIEGYILKITQWNVFAARPLVYGRRPKIRNFGTIRIGSGFMSRSFRLRSYITTLGGALIEIGNNGFINDGVNICASKSIRIGHNVQIADMVYIYDTDFHPVCPNRPTKQSPVCIGNNVWIGAHAIILAGSHIGDHSVIGAGSVVTGNIPAKSVVAGNPARVVKEFSVTDDWIRP
jgi:acetyltransferase-like isoleucine patch superfamily enzyme